jgi:WD40 repeat protein
LLLLALTLNAIATGNQSSGKTLPIADCAWNPVKRNLLASVSLDSITCLWDTSSNPPKKTIFECRAVEFKNPFLTIAWNVRLRTYRTFPIFISKIMDF